MINHYASMQQSIQRAIQEDITDCAHTRNMNRELMLRRGKSFLGSVTVKKKGEKQYRVFKKDVFLGEIQIEHVRELNLEVLRFVSKMES